MTIFKFSPEHFKYFVNLIMQFLASFLKYEITWKCSLCIVFCLWITDCVKVSAPDKSSSEIQISSKFTTNHSKECYLLLLGFGTGNT